MVNLLVCGRFASFRGRSASLCGRFVFLCGFVFLYGCFASLVVDLSLCGYFASLCDCFVFLRLFLVINIFKQRLWFPVFLLQQISAG